MRIAIMLRAYDRAGGIGIYSRNIVKHLLNIDHTNHYVLFYNNPKNIGLHQKCANVDEVYLPSTNPLLWDQVLVPYSLRKWDVDLIFNTKFSVPLMLKIKKIMVLHGASWFVHPELYSKFDIFYVRSLLPVYCRQADFLISNSELTTEDFIRLLKVPTAKIETIRLAAGDEFKPIEDRLVLDEVRRKYNLPDRFLLTVTSYDPRKNFGTLLKAFEICLQETPLQLVVIGKDCYRYSDDYQLALRPCGPYIHFPGWVEQHDLPAIYTLAEAFVFPSVYEEFGIPVVEAMSCGCPVVSSNTGAIPSLTKGSALLSAPFDSRQLSANILDIVGSQTNAAEYRKLGLKRAQDFSWSIAAQRTLDIFNRVVTGEMTV
jgi:glycosyltransferase involved in cell wall biosynthesis